MTGNSSQLVSLDAQLGPRESQKALFGLDGEALTALMVEIGEPGWRAGQLTEAIYRQRVTDLDAITTLPKSLRQRLRDLGWAVGRAEIVQVFTVEYEIPIKRFPFWRQRTSNQMRCNTKT